MHDADVEMLPSLTAAPHEQRRTPRALVEVDVSLYTETHFFAGLSEDLSEGGVFVATYETHAIGTHVDLTFTLPAGPVVKTTATVRWLRTPGVDTTPGMGLSFDALSAEALHWIRAFLKHRPPLLWEDDPL